MNYTTLSENRNISNPISINHTHPILPSLLPPPSITFLSLPLQTMPFLSSFLPFFALPFSLPPQVPPLIHPTSRSSKAKSYDTKPWQKKIAAQVASALNSHTSWLGASWSSDAADNECKLLDYACGTGSVTRVTSSLFLRYKANADIARKTTGTKHPHNPRNRLRHFIPDVGTIQHTPFLFPSIPPHFDSDCRFLL
jgi:hypothetical protein